jgi:hypothetical protein
VRTDHSFKVDKESMEAAGGEGLDRVLLTIQGAQTTIETGPQAQAPPPIVVVNNATKGE